MTATTDDALDRMAKQFRSLAHLGPVHQRAADDATAAAETIQRTDMPARNAAVCRIASAVFDSFPAKR